MQGPRLRGGNRARVAGAAAALLLTGCSGTDEEPDDPLHWDESSFVGTVTALNPYDLNALQVDQADVSLNLIGPVDGGCWDAEDSLREQAKAARDSLLPVGRRVLVVRAEDHDHWSFLHVLPERSDTPEPPAPAASVNEQLVGSGFWEPSGYELDDDDSDSTAAFGVRYPDEFSPVQAQYAPLIVAAGNSAKAAGTTGYGVCSAEVQQREASTRAWLQEAERQAEEDDRRRRAGGGGRAYCRDGDGDGVCYED